MARKVRGFERVLDAPALFAIAYGEIAASIYVALGIVAAQALGLTPLVLALTGLVFGLVALSYAEGTAAIPEVGGAETFTRRAFNDLVGFVTGWALFLDYLIVIALSALFVPHYVGAALGLEEIRDAPWDIVVGVVAIAAIGVVRLARRSRLHGPALAVALLDLAVQALIVVLGLALVFSPETLTDGLALAPGQDWLDDLLFAIPLGFLAYTGLETVANLAEEAREPGRTLPRSLFSAIGLVVLLTVLVATVGVSAFPAESGSTELGDALARGPARRDRDGLRRGAPRGGGRRSPRRRRSLGRARAADGGDDVDLGLCPPRVLDGRARDACRASSGRLERKTLVSREAIAAIIVVSTAVLILAAALGDETTFLASIYSFGVLLAFTLAQLAVIRLRRREPDLPRPFRAGPDIRLGGVAVPLPALVGAPLTGAIFVLALATHHGALVAGPVWLAIGLGVYAVTRVRQRRGMLEGVDPRAAPVGSSIRRVLVPMKLGSIGEEMVATAIALAKEHGATVEAITVVAVPREHALDEPLPGELAARAEASVAEARALGEENGVEVNAEAVPAALDRARDRRGGGSPRRRPHRARLVRPLAAAVAVLLADGRPRAEARAVRGARRRVPRGCPRELTSTREGCRRGVRQGGVVRGEGARRRGLGRHVRRRGRGRARPAR